MSSGFEREISVLREISEQRRIPGAQWSVLGKSLWLVEESGVSLPGHKPNFHLLTLGLTVLIGSFSLVAIATTPSSTPKTYCVKSGDSLWTIARKELGDGERWREIYRINKSNIPDPNKIQPSQKLVLPLKTPVLPKVIKKKLLVPSVAPTPTPTPRSVLEPMPEETPGNLSTPLPKAIVPPISSPTPVASASSKVSVKLGYWAANNELGTKPFGANDGMITTNLEWTPWGPDQAFGLSGNAMTYPSNRSAGIWDAYYRSGILKAGYRSDDLLRRSIPYGNANKQDLHSESLIAGLAFGLPLNNASTLNFDLFGGSTFHNQAVGTSERVLVDLAANIAVQLDARTDLALGYRSYVFGTAADVRNVYQMKNGRSIAFGSYQGPTLGIGHRF